MAVRKHSIYCLIFQMPLFPGYVRNVIMAADLLYYRFTHNGLIHSEVRLHHALTLKFVPHVLPQVYGQSIEPCCQRGWV